MIKYWEKKKLAFYPRKCAFLYKGVDSSPGFGDWSNDGSPYSHVYHP
jgi:hypothetical protein